MTKWLIYITYTCPTRSNLHISAKTNRPRWISDQKADFYSRHIDNCKANFIVSYEDDIGTHRIVKISQWPIGIHGTTAGTSLNVQYTFSGHIAHKIHIKQKVYNIGKSNCMYIIRTNSYRGARSDQWVVHAWSNINFIISCTN